MNQSGALWTPVNCNQNCNWGRGVRGAGRHGRGSGPGAAGGSPGSSHSGSCRLRPDELDGLMRQRRAACCGLAVARSAQLRAGVVHPAHRPAAGPAHGGRPCWARECCPAVGLQAHRADPASVWPARMDGLSACVSVAAGCGREQAGSAVARLWRRVLGERGGARP
jgi:hypothetical protein